MPVPSQPPTGAGSESNSTTRRSSRLQGNQEATQEAGTMPSPPSSQSPPPSSQTSQSSSGSGGPKRQTKISDFAIFHQSSQESKDDACLDVDDLLAQPAYGESDSDYEEDHPSKRVKHSVHPGTTRSTASRQKDQKGTMSRSVASQSTLHLVQANYIRVTDSYFAVTSQLRQLQSFTEYRGANSQNSEVQEKCLGQAIEADFIT